MEHATDEIKRTCEIEEFTNTYIIHPISSWLVPQFIKHNITPNMVSLFGMVCGIMAGICYYNYQFPLFAFVFHQKINLCHQVAQAGRRYA